MSKILSVALLAFSLTGCSFLREYTMPQDKNMISGASAILVMPEDGQVDVQSELNQLVKAMTESNLSPPQDNLFKYRRNELQSKIIMASNQKCGLYLREIAAAKSQSNMAWGSLSLLFSGAASVIPHVQTAKAFAAGSTAATGANSLYEQAYFNNLAVNVIAAGIAKQREGILLQIKELNKKSLLEYPVHRAVADALLYHSSCNVISGLEAAAVATKLAPSQPVLKDAVIVTPPPQVSPQL